MGGKKKRQGSEDEGTGLVGDAEGERPISAHFDLGMVEEGDNW